MGGIRESATAQSTKPIIDDTLADILQGYFFLSDQREIAIGMSGGLSLAIPITEMLAYYTVFKPPVSRKHYVRIIRACDNEYMRIQSETQARKNKSGSAAKGGSNSFPKLPPKQ